MQFTKMHGIGNDFVVVNALGDSDGSTLSGLQARSAALCDRHFGIGADGVIAVLDGGARADFRMRMFNPDGSEAEMCGNGIRCFAKYIYDKKLSEKLELNIETGAGLLVTHSTVIDKRVQSVTVDMGIAHLDRKEIPADLGNGKSGPIISEKLNVGGTDYNITCVSMGNPHCIVFVDDVATFPLEKVGPLFEKHAAFPNRINTEFVQVIGQTEIRMRVWERGASETLACGTGACASTVASALNGKTDYDVIVHLAGGDLRIEWRDDGRVLMTGAATTVYEGEL